MRARAAGRAAGLRARSNNCISLQYPWSTPPKVDRVRIVWLGIVHLAEANPAAAPIPMTGGLL